MMSPKENWEPGPEWLAAYADGELDRDPDLMPFKNQVEDWLALHPEARALVAGQRSVRDLFRQAELPPVDPRRWENILARVETAGSKAGFSLLGRMGTAAGLTAALIAGIWLILALSGKLASSRPEEAVVRNDPGGVEEFPVATADEIEILRVEGEDTETLVGVESPVKGPLELLSPGEFILTSVQPFAPDNMIPEVHGAGPAVPMVWARVGSER